MNLDFDNRFTNELPADPDTSNSRRQVQNAAYSLVEPTKVSAPKVVSVSPEAAALIDLDTTALNSDAFLQTFAGNQLLDGMQAYAMCYGGHQFGNWAGQLGDGRAINLGEVKNQNGDHWAMQLKGAGPTPYSRTADGLAVLRSSIREYLCSEAMYHLGVPTTRALSLIVSGEQVMRDMLYDGHPEYEPGAIVCRMSPSFIRFGNFQIFSARKQYDELRQLADFTIKHHFAHLLDQHDASSKALYLAWFKEVCELTATMVVDWMRVGFVHGVMNTDNMSILGLTIDYGPYGWLDDFNPEWTPNTTDAQNRRYRYGQQGNVALWNLYQLANSLYPLIEETEGLEALLSDFQQDYQDKWLNMMASKLGLAELQNEVQKETQENDSELFQELERLLTLVEVDMSIFYRLLAKDEIDVDLLEPAFYQVEQISDEYRRDLQAWLDRYLARAPQNRAQQMNRVNPKYVFRNYLAQQAIDKAEAGDYSMVNELLEVFRNPYDEQTQFEHYSVKRPDWARTKVGCSMLSCSS